MGRNRYKFKHEGLPLLVPHERWPVTHVMGLDHSLPICPDPYLDFSVQSQAHFFLPRFARYRWLSFSAAVDGLRLAAFERLIHMPLALRPASSESGDGPTASKPQPYGALIVGA